MFPRFFFFETHEQRRSLGILLASAGALVPRAPPCMVARWETDLHTHFSKKQKKKGRHNATWIVMVAEDTKH